MTPAEFGKLVADETEKWRKVSSSPGCRWIRRAGVTELGRKTFRVPGSIAFGHPNLRS